MTDAPTGLFAGQDPFDIARAWLAEAGKSEPNDPNAISLATAGADGLPNVRVVLMKEIEGATPAGGFVFYTNYESAKGEELAQNPQAAFVMHWKSLLRQVRARGPVEKVSAEMSDAYFATRAYQSRVGAWASKQSRPLSGKAALLAEAAKAAASHPFHVPRPPHWGGYRIRPLEIEFWSDGEFRMHDRFRWTRPAVDSAEWTVTRLNP
ncbi:pyridoxamine 5'-phosphate oxidase [Rubrimonas sp.]|uniref:pyridoxamine 5'-phosphate oxidase n=1 Tax=Rubrimonas sp. TaxID=2036015 RepID=UPI002FDE06E8